MTTERCLGVAAAQVAAITRVVVLAVGIPVAATMPLITLAMSTGVNVTLTTGSAFTADLGVFN
jgi:hypothetical protein